MGALSRWSPQLLSILRIVTALCFIEHGTSKFFHFPMSMGPGSPTGLMLVAGLLEVVGGVLVLLGLLTRPAALVLSGEMAVAYWMVHAKMGPYPIANMGEPAVLYCFIFLYLAAAGAGAWSLDKVLFDRRRGLEPAAA
jgi:putative oxidoreductase